MAKLVALVPRPRTNLTRFNGVLAPNSRYREQIIPTRSVKVKKPLLMKWLMEEKSRIRQLLFPTLFQQGFLSKKQQGTRLIYRFETDIGLSWQGFTVATLPALFLSRARPAAYATAISGA